MKRYAEAFLHVVFWILIGYLVFNNLGMKVVKIKSSGEIQEIVSMRDHPMVVFFLDFFFKMIMFYWLSLRALPAYLTNRNRQNLVIIIGIFLATFMISQLTNYLIAKAILTYFPLGSPRLFSLSILLHFFTLLLALAYSLLKERLRMERVRKEIKETNLRTELDFLKSQINPHFLFNTLNNLYAESKKHKNPTLSNGIAKLSHMMRYMLYESNGTFVPLEHEVAYLNSFIELQMLRISPEDPFELSKDISNYHSSIRIAPLLFQPFLENAFKHGVKLEARSYIKIRLNVQNDLLYFSVKNSKSTDSRPIEHSGIGLANIKRRLALIYPDRHKLQIDEDADEFHVQLKIQL